MKITLKKISAALFTGLGLAAFVITSADTGRAQNKDDVVAPYIVKDTVNDSPGTNIVTRVVTFSAEIGGTPTPALQWKVDKGGGFEAIPGATSPIYRIGNAQVVHNGFYALFATNSAGSLHTTPQRLVVEEGED